ncbi:hypothetical protein ACF0H5_012533 [Mactra antiquata]
MGFGDASIFLKVVLILLIVAFVIQILGVALPYWYAEDFGSASYNGGLFRSCNEVLNKKKCSSIKNPADWFAATQAFELIGLFLIIGALVLTIVVVFVKNDMKILKLVAWILSFCAFGFIIIGIIIYGAEATHLLKEYSGAFAITIIAGLVCLAAGVLGLLDWMGKSV